VKRSAGGKRPWMMRWVLFPLACIVVLCAGFAGYRMIVRIPSIVLSQLPAEPNAPFTLRIATFNIQDTPFVSSHNRDRMRAAAIALAALDPDIVGFQESFLVSNRKLLTSLLQANSRLRYHQYFPSPLLGSGLLISSAFPIVESSFMRFTSSNPFYCLSEGDWWAGKGVALVRLELPAGNGTFDVFNTHAQASYASSDYVEVRTEQMTELAHFVNTSRANDTPAILVGDLNCRIGATDYETAVQGASLVRQMTLGADVDHIFSVENARYGFELISTVPIQGLVEVGSRYVPLSDHIGYLSVLRILPDSNTGR